ncbi:sigma-54 interaction domain-containing protein [Vreelandella piezotolerans]|uniref:Sigma-54-dependent Fis family transcriptional regulator n=1 Tax=Vreelandella piezotolerans TaxID=2609667 RepID=A0ABQ6XA77_9GAMM|nr:sigma-54 dependent transcriptional regulator [Halomonas piezotolerans]KAE8438913.1 sigma-54-dependent Fis family transcriptional regulator [Halomonas piezotolerans]QJA25292.1 sigma-54-dependent Fis family transcriptional regulator [Halomonas piezotolerans]
MTLPAAYPTAFPSRLPVELAGMPFALTLVESSSPSGLRQQAAKLLQRHLGLTLAECLYVEGSGRWLGRDSDDLQFDCADFSHPYAHVIRSNKPLALSVADARIRLDHPGFQAQLSALSGALQLNVLPLRALDGAREWLGALLLVGQRETLTALENTPEMGAFEALLCRLWSRLTREQGERHRSQALQASLAKLNDGARRQTLADRLADDLLGQSAVMSSLRQHIIRAAETQLAVLLQGQTGTGKDRVARAIHQFSTRSKAPFLAINCAAIPEALLESELFGHAKGAFSGADKAREGLISQADGGTLFLDEIGDMPLALQAKLLRVLESGRYRPLGASEERCADLRLVAATHQPLKEQIKQQRFRADLYYRLGQFPINVPPLSERRDDIALLAQAFITAFCQREERDDIGITPAALRLLKRREYPGNVRELKNIVDYACAMTPAGADIDVDVLPGEHQDVATLTSLEEVMPNEFPLSDEVDDLRQALREVETSIIRQRLRRFGGNRARAAESLGLPKRTLAHKCQQLELDGK